MPHHRLTRAALFAVLILGAGLGLAGCGHGAPSDPDPSRAAIRDIGGDPDHVYATEILIKPLGQKQYDQKKIYLVPDTDPKTFRIVDESGHVYQDYEDFLLNNGLTS